MMTREREIRANYDRNTVVIYQAFSPAIAEPALREQRFVSPFSFHRMTWIKPSFLWLMHRSHWGRKGNQQKILAVRIRRQGWESALARGVLTHPEPSIFSDPTEWQERFQSADVHIQWDTERSLRGAPRNQFSIQVGISRHLIREYVDEWVTEINDMTPTVVKIRNLLRSGRRRQAQALLPAERTYPVDHVVGRQIHVSA